MILLTAIFTNAVIANITFYLHIIINIELHKSILCKF